MRRAFTLIEMLAATVLTVLLMVLVLRVVGSMSRRQMVLEQQSRVTGGGWPPGLVDLLRFDLAQARGYQMDPRGLTLTGCSGIDPGNLESDHQPVTILYAVQPIDGHHWLVRRQTRRISDPGHNSWMELVCPDVGSLSLEPLDQSEMSRLVTQATAPTAEGLPMPRRMRLVVRSDRAGIVPLDQAIVLP